MCVYNLYTGNMCYIGDVYDNYARVHYRPITLCYPQVETSSGRCCCRCRCCC